MSNKLTLPCINCITLPICKSLTEKVKLNYPHRSQLANFSFFVLELTRRLSEKCSLVKQYCGNKHMHQSYVYWNDRMTKVAEYLLTLKKKETNVYK